MTMTVLFIDYDRLSLLKEILHCCLQNSFGLGLHQILHFLVESMNKSLLVLPDWSRFFTPGVFLHINTFCVHR